MYKKRGISPLITTVLLLGLIISLATVAIIWSRSNIKTTLKGAERSYIKLTCKDVEFDILSACYEPIESYDGIKITVKNNKDKPINAGFMVRIIGGDTSINPSAPDTSLDANDVKTFTVPFDVEGTIKEISVLPKIRSERENPVVCTNQALNLKVDDIKPC
ncbi:hypothetical protein CL621_02060 [archaeon]|nr:hypothetical protein [archaeon]|tara:strand:+ start:2296 stop:2778 length:483 start_codon:yes stop_codon:yes gene_type:complete